MKHGIKVIYHANFADEEAIDLLEANKDWVFVSPNIGFTATASYEGEKWFTEEQVVEFGFREELAGAAKGLKELKKRGIRILGGGDYGFFVTPHGENARDLEHLIRYCEFTPMELLLTMTKHGARRWICRMNSDRFSRDSLRICCWWRATRSSIQKCCSTARSCSRS